MSEKESRKSKFLRWLWIVFLGIFLGVAVSFAIMIPFLKGDYYLDGSGLHSKKDLPQVTDGKGIPNVWKSLEDSYCGIDYLYIYFSGNKDTVDKSIIYMQFPSRHKARKAYRLMKRNGFSSFEEEERNYFIGWEKGVTDASIQKMVCLSGKVIVSTDVYVSSEWATYENDPTPSSFSYPDRRQYILDHFVN